MGWEPEKSEWDKHEARETANQEAKLLQKIKDQFGLKKGDTLIVMKRTGTQHTLAPDHLITQIIRVVQQGELE
jgi:hypothetical protein